MNYQFPIEEVRSNFAALNRTFKGKQIIYFDGPGGTQMVNDASEEMMSYIKNGMANLHGAFNTSVETEEIIDEARAGMSDLVGCEAKEVAFGANMTSLNFSIARSLADTLQEGDEVIVTEIDHHANIDPWLTIARQKGATVKFIKLDLQTCTLNLSHLEQIITAKTKIVAVGMSSNVTGTVTRVEEIIQAAKNVDALVVLDAVHAVPHIPIDFKALNCDILLCSAYKFFGPHVGIAVIKQKLFERLQVYKLDPAPKETPYKLETGTQNHEGIAGIAGTIRFIESLGEGTSRRERCLSAIQRIDEYEMSLADDLESFLTSLPQIKLFRAPIGSRRTPTFAFTIENMNPADVTKWLFDHSQLCVANGDFYASTMAKKFNIASSGGWVRVGLAPYNTIEEITKLKKGLSRLVELGHATAY